MRIKVRYYTKHMKKMGGEGLAKDPICGMNVNPTDADYESVYKDETYYFCSKRCKTQFDKEPEKYVK